MNSIDIHQLVNIAQEAGLRIMSIYQQADIVVQNKADNSALTQADMDSHHFICESLQALYPDIPIISEESAQHVAYETRKTWDYFFLVDPLDGTKEFIKKNGEFTVNIALVYQNQPVLGVIHAPALELTYFAEKGQGAYKFNREHLEQLDRSLHSECRIIMSRSHLCDQTQAFVNDLIAKGKKISTISAGSALKFGLIAEGKADIYPRFSPTMEWDTAAGQILVEEIGKTMTRVDNSAIFTYNKPQLINPGFIVQ